jgi:hypothetical protein
MAKLSFQVFIFLALIHNVFATDLATGADALLESGRKAAIKELNSYPNDNSDVGVGFRVFRIETDKVMREPTPQDYQSIVIPTYRWLYLVVNKNKLYTTLEMFFVDNRWSRGPSGTGFAQPLLNIMKAWPASSGYHYRYISGEHLHEDLFEISIRGKVIGIVRLLPSLIESDKTFNSIDLTDPKILWMELLPNLRRSIELNRQIKRTSRLRLPEKPISP